MKKYLFDKLIRDKGYQMLLDKGANVDMVKNPDILAYTKKKMLEELEEILDAKTKEEKVDEIADFMEILSLFMDIEEITLEEVEVSKRQKLDKKGGFAGKYVVNTVEVPDDHEFVKYYEAAPDKYVEIKEKS